MMLTLSRLLNDERLIAGVLLPGAKRQLWENRLYLKYHYLIREALWRHRLDEEKASIAYSDTIMTVLAHIRDNRFEQRSSLKTYVKRIYYNKCIDSIRANESAKGQMHEAENLDGYLEVLPDESKDIVQRLTEHYEVAALKRRIQLMDDKCRQIIEAWGEGYHDREIAKEMGYQSAAVAKTSRLRCLDKLKKSYLYVKGLMNTANERAD